MLCVFGQKLSTQACPLKFLLHFWNCVTNFIQKNWNPHKLTLVRTGSNHFEGNLNSLYC